MEIRTLIILLFLASHAHAADCPDREVVDGNLNVYIVAVSEFAVDWTGGKGEALSAEIETAGREVAEHFCRNFPKARVRLYDTPEETAHEALVGSLRQEFRYRAGRRLNLLFVISHGFKWTSGNTRMSGDLAIATYDTPRPILGDVPEDRTIKVARELFQWISDMESGSVVLAFIDTCFSGAADSALLNSVKAQIENNGIRALLVASALSEERAYNAAFSRALVDYWSDDTINEFCTEFDDNDWIAEIQSKMREVVPIEFDGPSVLLEYKGELCADTFDKHNSILLVYNALPIDISYQLLNADFDVFRSGTFKRDDATVIRLNQGTYYLRSRNVPELPAETIDFSSNRVHELRFGTPTEVTTLAAADRQFVSEIVTAGLVDEDTAETIARLAVRHAMVQEPLALAARASGTAFAAIDNSIALTDYARAGRDLLSQARDAATATEREELGELAYYAYAASGKVARAERISNELDLTLSCDDCVALSNELRSRWYPPALDRLVGRKVPFTRSEAKRQYQTASAVALLDYSVDQVIHSLKPDGLQELIEVAIPGLDVTSPNE